MIYNTYLFLLLISSFNIISVLGRDKIFTENIQLDIGMTIIVFFISIITTIGGVGGGGLLIPTYLLIGKFNLEHAIPLSVITILGDTTVRLISLFNKKHPLNNNRFLIELTPLLILVPFDANTSFIGVILSKSLPHLFTIISIILILGFTFYKSISKAILTFKNENKYLNDNSTKLIIIDGIAQYFSTKDIENNQLIEQSVLDDTFSHQMYKMLILFFLILIISIFSITRSFINKCSLFFWGHIILQICTVSILGMIIINYIKQNYNNKRNSQYAFIKGDLVWNNTNIYKFIFIASITGLLSTYLGIGGGMLTTPVMMNVGMLPEVVVATSSISTFFSSLITCVNYILEGKLLIDYGIVFAISSGFGSIIGLKLSDYILSKFNRQSIIIFMVAFILFISVILLSLNSFINSDINKFKFIDYCNDK